MLKREVKVHITKEDVFSWTCDMVRMLKYEIKIYKYIEDFSTQKCHNSRNTNVQDEQNTTKYAGQIHGWIDNVR